MMHAEIAAPEASGRQQAPRGGCGQVVAEQAVTLPFQTPLCEAQSAWVRIAHVTEFEVGDAKQHAPTGCGLQIALGVEEPHDEPLPFHTPPAVARHWDSLVMMHGTKGAVEAVRQQAPCGGGAHEVLVHTVFAPSQLPLQAACVVIEQLIAPVVFGRQHAPVTGGTGHGLGLQTVPLPWYWPPTA